MSKTGNAVKIFNEYALQYEAKYMNVDAYSPSLDVFCKLLPKSEATVLELACGPGNITKYLLQKQPTLQILATDLSENMLNLAARNNPKVNTQKLDCKDIKKLEKRFDALVCGFGLPYLSKEETKRLITDAAEVLNSKGVLYLSTMEGNYVDSGYVGPSSDPEKKELYTFYHEAPYLLKTLEESGFNNVIVDRIQHSETETDLIIIAQK
ncbi:Methyltransferase domain-containing protein [Zhouia amylolytica]|uniref:Methyltransferase domain-containing protein n=1 Tax=Zhouia amylolytica TaxID=376730 RepID=A0A1I6PD14_9FLAO|nr:class I SAM-dependent methyltransferase [Zhouia amylolytica]SFS38097.1 Methyltransferase domain-containing protein [Zhouia amylolytica]